MFIKEKKYRNQKRIKVYGCVFICMSSKAVHIEIVSELTSDAFIAALRRFVGRRGVPAHIYSDNGTNFVGAHRELKELYVMLESEECKNKRNNYVLKNKIHWHFNPPLSLHFGGLWEAAVKSFKYHFKRVVGDRLLTIEELLTFVVEIEAILNSRPLCPISSDPNDPLVLTLAHLLIGKPLTMLPESNVSCLPDKRLNNWQLFQKIRMDFWRRWQIEYLTELQKRRRVIELHPGDDDVVRVVTIKTAKGIFKRNALNGERMFDLCLATDRTHA
ncbi:uncharacterized protein [Prorops nasuta]|uniref:uncharacterized protein n=1 Tax=Prorops nasuta TaxID=863751 RepID=UPI0034CDF048